MARQRYLIALIFFCSTTVMAGLTAEEVLNKCTQTLDKTYTSFITQAKSHVHKHQKFSGARVFMTGEEEKFAKQQFRTDGKRMKVISQQWGDRYNGSVRYFRPENESAYNVDIYDGEKRYEHARGHGDPGTLIVHIKDAEKSMYSLSAQIAQKNCISLAFGYIHGDLERFDHIIRDAGPEKMSMKEEQLHGTLHYVIEAETERGHYKVWINPEKGYHFSKALLVKDAGDLYNRVTFPEDTVQRTLIENTEFKKVDGLWVPVKTSIKFNDTYPDGGHSEGTQTVELIMIQINPDHDALNSFSTDGIADGARAMIPGEPTQYYWQDGMLVPKANKTPFRR